MLYHCRAPAATDGAVLMPPELTFQERGDWSSGRGFHQAQRAWLLAHGIENAYGHEASKVHSASKRAHAQIVRELDSLGRLLHRNLHGRQGPNAPVIRDAHGGIV